MSPAGEMIESWWQGLSDKFPNVDIDAYVVMPNHFHGILSVMDTTLSNPCARPTALAVESPTGTDIALAGRPHRVAPTLGDIVAWYKTMTTNNYMRMVRQGVYPPFKGKLWQRNYYEHIVRNDYDLGRIREYIRDNPAKWATDRENPDT